MVRLGISSVDFSRGRGVGGVWPCMYCVNVKEDVDDWGVLARQVGCNQVNRKLTEVKDKGDAVKNQNVCHMCDMAINKELDLFFCGAHEKEPRGT